MLRPLDDVNNGDNNVFNGPSTGDVGNQYTINSNDGLPHSSTCR